jgi:hypothetical protein
MDLLRRKRRRTAGEDGAPSGKALVAAALPLEGRPGKQAWQASSGDDQWQRQAWYYYDAIGELRFAYNLLANAVSRATLFAAETDPETGKITGPTEDARAQAAAAKILGGMDERPQNQSTMALHWQVGGETYILILPQTGEQEDRWLVLSRTGLRMQGSTWQFKDPLTGVWTRMRDGIDRMIRVWSPHPDDQVHADSAMRAAIPICQEIEKASQNIVSKLNSRLASNGLYFLPQELDFATADGEAANAQTFMKLIMEVMEANIADPGSAAAQVPIMADVPGEMIAQLANGHVDLSTALDSTVGETREAAVTRLGRTVDMPRETALGQTAEANHWSAWQVEETTYKLHVEPFLLKLGMAITREYFRPILKSMGEGNPDRFVLAWDVTEVVSRPDDTEDVKYLFEQNLVSADWVLSKFGVPDDAKPSDEEARFNLARTIVINAPSTLENASVAALLGLEPTVTGNAVIDGPQGVDEPGDNGNVRALPQRQSEPPEPDEGLVASAELVAFDALSRAGGRLLTRQYRGQFTATPKWELHTVIPQDGRESELMEGSFQFTDNIAHAFNVSPVGLNDALRQYVENRLQWGAVHERDVLRGYLRTVARA